MVSNARFAEVAAVVGDPARAAMLHALLDGRALTASELAGIAGITPQTASGHLARLTDAGLMVVVKQGRHRYHRLASSMVARMMESIMCVATDVRSERTRLITGPRDAALRTARICYDHLAGRLAVALTDAMIDHGHVDLTDDSGLVTASGLEFLDKIGIDLGGLSARRGRHTRRVFCRPCLDWSERRPHLAGMIGAALRDHSFDRGWVRSIDGSRAVRVTLEGRRAFRDHFGVDAA